MTISFTKIKNYLLIYQEVLRRLMPILGSLDTRSKRHIFLGFIALLLSNLLNTISPFFLKDIIDSSRTPTASTLHSLLLLGIFYVGTWSLGQILSQVKELIVISVMGRIKTSLSKQIVSSILKMPTSSLGGKSAAQLADPVLRVEETFPLFFSGLFFYFLPVCLELILIFIIISFLLPIKFFIVFIVMLVSYFIFTMFSLGILSHKLDISIQASEYMRSDLCDRLTNFESIKSLCQEAYENRRFSSNFLTLEKARVSSEKSFELLRLGQNCILSAGMFLIVLLGLHSVSTKSIDIGTFILLTAYLYQLVGPLSSLGTIIKDVKEGAKALHKGVKLIQPPPEEGIALWNTHSSFEILTFKKVNFSYGSQKNILHNVSCTLKKGQVTALVGQSGSGKTTLARLLMKYYNPSSGEIRIDGTPYTRLPSSFLRNSIGYVNQEALLFHESILANLRYGNPEATFEDIEKALEMVSLKDYVLSLPSRYDTIVGERGTQLSGGQRQRLCIARTFLGEKSLYIFDEATSAIDSATQRRIYPHIQNLSENSAVLIISHRLHEIQESDQILVIEGGSIIEQGTHEELLRHKGKYFILWTSSTANYENQKNAPFTNGENNRISV